MKCKRTSAIVVGPIAGGEQERVYNKPLSEERYSHKIVEKNKSMIQRGLIILIVGEALFIIGVILAVVWGVQLAETVASAFQFERA